MDPVISYLKIGELPENKTEARILRLKASRYVIYDDKLYRRGYSMSLLKCVTPFEANYFIREIHESIFGNHTGGNPWHSKHSDKVITDQQ